MEWKRPDHQGTKFSPVYELQIAGGKSYEIRLRLSKTTLENNPLLDDYDTIFRTRLNEADAFYDELCVEDAELKNVQRQAFAGMLWNKQYYNLDIPNWLNGDPGLPPPPASRKKGRNSEWFTLNNEGNQQSNQVSSLTFNVNAYGQK